MRKIKIPLIILLLISTQPWGLTPPHIGLHMNSYGFGVAGYQKFPQTYLGIIDSGFISFSFSLKDKSDKKYFSTIDKHMAENVLGDASTGSFFRYQKIEFCALSPVYNNFSFGIGLSYITLKHYKDYYDPSHILGEHGVYTVDDHEEAIFGIDMKVLYSITQDIDLYVGYGLSKYSDLSLGLSGRIVKS